MLTGGVSSSVISRIPCMDNCNHHHYSWNSQYDCTCLCITKAGLCFMQKIMFQIKESFLMYLPILKVGYFLAGFSAPIIGHTVNEINLFCLSVNGQYVQFSVVGYAVTYFFSLHQWCQTHLHKGAKIPNLVQGKSQFLSIFVPKNLSKMFFIQKYNVVQHLEHT